MDQPWMSLLLSDMKYYIVTHSPRNAMNMKAYLMVYNNCTHTTHRFPLQDLTAASSTTYRYPQYLVASEPPAPKLKITVAIAGAPRYPCGRLSEPRNTPARHCPPSTRMPSTSEEAQPGTGSEQHEQIFETSKASITPFAARTQTSNLVDPTTTRDDTMV
jgi:hypothetical protein